MKSKRFWACFVVIALAIMISFSMSSCDRIPTQTPTTPPPVTITPAPSYPAPTLISPASEATIVGEKRIEFSWHWDGTLQEKEKLELRIWRSGKSCSIFAMLDECSVLLDAPPDGFGHYLWQVAVVRIDENGNRTILSESLIRSFAWGDGTLTAVPPALILYLRETLTETGFVALSGDQVDAGEIYREGKYVYGEASVQIGATTYHFDKPQIGPGEPEQLPDPWRVEFEFDRMLVARTGNQAGFNPKKAQFWVGFLDGHSAVEEESPYSLTMKLYEGNALRKSIQVFFAVKDAPESGGSRPRPTPTRPLP